MKKIKVAVVFGGPSSEHEVSLKSAENVIKNLDITKFEFLQIKISREGIWIDQETGKQFSESEGVKYLKEKNVDLVFIAMHGEYGEDGTIQKVLEESDIKFTGSSSISSSLAMDKFSSNKAFEKAGFDVPAYINIGRKQWNEDGKKCLLSVLDSFSLPIVVKPTDRGSSVGTSIVEDKEHITAAIKRAFEVSDNVMIQRFIKGRELTCAVIEDKNGNALPLIPTEIIPNKEYKFFDFDAKYLTGASAEVTPPDLPGSTIKKIQELAVKSHKTLGCSHISRTDFILSEGRLYILEVNTLPGMTQTSLLPQGAKAMGIDFPTLTDTIIEAALR